MEEKKKRMLTGDRPTGRLHIGHYFGSLKTRVEMQNTGKYDPYILIADVQALTDNFENPEKVRQNVRQVILDYLSVGIDPEKTTIYIQSMVPETAELTVFYSNLVTIARLERNPTVKTELAQKRDVFGESVTYGFLGYPVSQAADITIFDGKYIPVGEDQLPLIEQAREIVRKFNSIYGETFTEPEHLLTENKRIKGLDGNEKMGKSLGNAVYLVDNEEIVRKKIMAAVTDPNRIKKDDKGNPVAWVNPGNNHHVAIYRDEDGKYKERTVTFWEAVDRCQVGIPAIVTQPDTIWDNILQRNDISENVLESLPDVKWQFVLSLQQNEMFILGMNEEDYRYAMDQQDYALLNKYLYRVQKLSKGDYNFRYHTETSVEDKYDGKLNLELSRQMGKLKRVSIKSLLGLNPHKVHISVLGEIKEIS